MKNLGKIALLILLFPFALFGDIRASLDSTTVELGDMVTFNLKISGDDIQKPIIHSLCDSDIISTGSQTSIEIINGSYQKSYVLSYKFLPQKSCVIKPIEIEIDKKIEKSNSVNLTVKAVVASKDSLFKLTLQSDKKEVFVGESFEMTLLFKQKQGAEAVDSKFVPPVMKGFWIKNEAKPTRHQEGNYVITKIVYTIAAQREGELKVTKAQMRIASRSKSDRWNSFLSGIKWKTYFSNELNMVVKPLPSGVKLIGDFTISAEVDKNEINANEAVNIEIRVNGVGNLEDIKSFKPSIAGVSVFDEKISIDKTKLTQKLAFVGEDSFTIPTFSIKYFDLKTKEIKTISTKEIKIKVKNPKKKENLVIKRETQTQIANETGASNNISTIYIIIALLIGFIIGILVMIFKPWELFKKERKTISLKNPKTLLIKLLPFKDNKDVGEIINILEKNIYYGDSVELDKKKVKIIIEKYGID